MVLRSFERCPAFRYIPGAGDDEETWAQGLAPGMFWNNLEKLLAPGPTGIAERVAELVQEPQLNLPHNYVDHTPAGASHSTMQYAEAASPIVSSDSSMHTPVATDAHHLKPRGCGTQLPQRMHEVATGACLHMRCHQRRGRGAGGKLCFALSYRLATPVPLFGIVCFYMSCPK